MAKKPKSSGRPFWIKNDDDWKVITDLGANSFQEGVQKWISANPTMGKTDCFWKHYGRTCMNKHCPACN